MEVSIPNITQLLHRWQKGDQNAFAELSELIYQELYRRAQWLMAREGKRSFSSTDLIGELYLKLMGQQEQNWHNRNHFFKTTVTIMRHILVNQAKSRKAQKRGGNQVQVSADIVENLSGGLSHPEVFLKLDQGLTQLAERYERAARIFELRYLAGMNAIEIATLFQVHEATVRRDCVFAKTWLGRYIREGL